MPCRFRILVCLALIAWSGMAAAVVYKWTDAQGKLQYGDTPPDGVHAEIVELLGIHAARSASNQPSAAAPAPQPAAPSGKTSSGEIQKTVDQDVAQIREKQCADARERYRQLIEGRHLYREGADGAREYLTSDQIDAERITAKRAADDVCDNTT